MRPFLVVCMVSLALVACGEAADTAPTSASPSKDRFDSARAWKVLEHQVGLGERPAGSPASRELAAYLKRRVPNGRYQRVPDGLRNVIGTVRGFQGFTAPFVFCSLETARTLLPRDPRQPEQVMHVLARCGGPEQARVVAQRLRDEYAEMGTYTAADESGAARPMSCR